MVGLIKQAIVWMSDIILELSFYDIMCSDEVLCYAIIGTAKDTALSETDVYILSNSKIYKIKTSWNKQGVVILCYIMITMLYYDHHVMLWSPKTHQTFHWYEVCRLVTSLKWPICFSDDNLRCWLLLEFVTTVSVCYFRGIAPHTHL